MSKNYLSCQLNLAVSAVRQNRLTPSKAAREYQVPRQTIVDHARLPSLTTRRGPCRELAEEEEDGLANFIIYMSNQGFPLTRHMIRAYIQEMYEQSGKESKFNLERGPSNKWFRNFGDRHPELSERVPEQQDKSRTRMSNGPIIDRFFDFFSSVVEEHELTDKPDQIYNCDETGWSGKERSRQKVFGPKKGHVFRQKVVTADHVTAHLCVSAGGRVLPPMVIFKGCLPLRDYGDGIPGSWMFAARESGYMDSILFYEWFTKGFIPNCGRARPVMLVMDNHDSHISKKVVEAARANDIVLVGLPSHTTHILQPLDVHVIGPLKEKFSKLAVHLGFGNQTLVVGKAKFPIVLNYALDQITPSSIKEAFRMAGIYPIDRNALDNTQIVEEMFTSTPVQGETGHELPTTCESCGQYVGENPLVRRGLIPQSMANVFKPPPSKPAADKTKKKRVVTEGRVISGDEMLRLLKEKEEMALKKKEDVEKRKSDMVEKKIQKQKEEEERRQNRQKEKEERQLKRKRIEEEKAEKRQKKASEKIHRMDEREEMNRAIVAYQYVCGVCGEHGRTSDEARGIMWYGCDSSECGRWFHGMCLCEREREIALRSLSVSECDWWCRQCSPWMYEE